jgi:hypothetical protein
VTETLTEGKPRVTDVIVDGRVVNFRVPKLPGRAATDIHTRKIEL